MYYSIDMNIFYSKDNLVVLHFKYDFWHGLPRLPRMWWKSGRQFSMTFPTFVAVYRQQLGEFCLPNGQVFVAYPHRPMTLHSPTENSLAVLNLQDLDQFTGPKHEIRQSPNVSFNKSIVARAV
ncbi:hypothetical protein TNCV_1738781 [Trichonephila clavipes]|nr:hypothetical protein TNCV_1738781 [Trichonephila clavipes]